MMRSVHGALRRAFGLPAWPPGGIVLLYHRIAELASDPQCLCVTPRHFAQHLDVIAEHGVPMTLDALIRAAQDHALPHGAVAVTFDDGYEDNLRCAAPLLEHARVPATVFVCTGPLGGDREFWWDELERLLLRPGLLPQHLRLQVGDSLRHWDLTGAREWSELDCARHRSWTVIDEECPTPRHRAYLELGHQLRSVPGAVRERVLNELALLSGMPGEVRPTHRPLRADEIAQLGRSRHITIGSHTHSHSSLAGLSPGEQRREIASAKHQLEELTGQTVGALAYPFGGDGDVSDCATRVAREEGVTMACTTRPDSVRAATPPYRIPRVAVRDWTRSQFLQRWSSWTPN
jgi:peptidoglycan/xylan/chitin deacetylase (PgdA/CDA1 family)